MPRNQSRAGQRARAAQKATGTKDKYTELLRAKLGPRGARQEPAYAEPARRLAAQLRAGLGADGEKAARLVDEAVAWAVKDRELKHALLRAPGGLTARARLQPALDEHAVGEVTVHDAPLVQVVYMVLEMAAEEEESASADLLRAAADVLDRLLGASHIRNPAIYGVRRMAHRAEDVGAHLHHDRSGRGRCGGGPAHDAGGRPHPRRGRTDRRRLHVHPSGGCPFRADRRRPRRPPGRLNLVV
ncbi:hypothetical protein [Streptomyces sp. NPDC047841]|uniref:hypothetical protein n=1 Tax=Streptomyces sp. NPDC047841 TaxID=3154708 RepID=UPI0034537557